MQKAQKVQQNCILFERDAAKMVKKEPGKSFL